MAHVLFPIRVRNARSEPHSAISDLHPKPTSVFAPEVRFATESGLRSGTAKEPAGCQFSPFWRSLIAGKKA